MDREPMYVYVHIGLFLVGLGIGARPEGAGVLADLGLEELRILALLMMMGSFICLVGTCWRTSNEVDVRTPYLMAGAGQLQVVTALGFYSYQITAASDLIGTLSGGLSVAIGLGCLHISTVAIKEYLRLRRLT